MTSPSRLTKFTTFLLARPTLYVGGVLVVVLVVIIWPLINLFRDLPLPADKIQSQQLKVNDVQLEQVNSRLQIYRQPQEVESITTIFRSVSGS